MKSKYNIPLILFVSITISCKKQEIPQPQTIQNTTSVPFDDARGITFVIYDATLYMKNSTTGQLVHYDHFGAGNVISSLDPFGGPHVSLDTIIQNVTTWQFNQNGYFILNGTKSYPYNLFNNTQSVYGLENGSARPITILRSTTDYMNVSIYKSYITINNIDYEFYTVITLKRQGYNGSTIQESVAYGSVYNGIINSNISSPQNLAGTSWVISKYISQLSTVITNDTLNFITSTAYTINNGANRTYQLSNITGSTMKSLTLNGCTTLGGDYSGQVIGSFQTDGYINNAYFTNMFNSNQTVRVWMYKL
jgi:hypothetical protein